MGRRKVWVLVWLLAATLPALLLQAPSARGDELLVNGGFEDGIAPWTAVGGGELDSVGQPTHEGQFAACVTATGRGVKRISQLIPVAGGGEYEFAGWVLKDDPRIRRVYLTIEWCKSDQGVLDCSEDVDASLHWIEGDSEAYQPITTGPVIGRIAADSARLRIVIEPVSTDPPEGFTVYLDGFSFTGPPAPTPTSTPSLTPPPTQTPPPTVSPSPTAVPTATQVPTPKPSPASPSPTATSRAATPLPVAGLVNGGFEEADGEGKPLGWWKYGGELSRSSVARRDGQYAAAFTSRTTSTKWAFQTVAVEGGEAYVLSGYALKNDVNVGAAYLRLSWYASPDGSGKAIDSVDSTTRLTDDSLSFRLLSTGAVVAPAEAASAKVRLMLDPLSEAEGTVYFDDVSLDRTTMVPQPMETPQPSPPLASSESPAASPVAPVAAVEEPEPSLSPNALPPRPSPAVLSATPSSPEATAFSRNGSSQSKEDPKGSPTRPSVVLYRERRPDQSIQEGARVTAGGDEDNGLSLIALVLAVVPPAAAVAAAAFFGWHRWKKRARPP